MDTLAGAAIDPPMPQQGQLGAQGPGCDWTCCGLRFPGEGSSPFEQHDVQWQQLVIHKGKQPTLQGLSVVSFEVRQHQMMIILERVHHRAC